MCSGWGSSTLIIYIGFLSYVMSLMAKDRICITDFSTQMIFIRFMPRTILFLDFKTSDDWGLFHCGSAPHELSDLCKGYHSGRSSFTLSTFLMCPSLPHTDQTPAFSPGWILSRCLKAGWLANALRIDYRPTLPLLGVFSVPGQGICCRIPYNSV